MPPTHVLIIDPAPARRGLANRLKQLGYHCVTAQGLHDAMVQAIIRSPGMIVADLTETASNGAACRNQLEQMDHFRHTPFFTIGTNGDLGPDADTETVIRHIRQHLPEPATPEPDPSPQAPGTGMPLPDPEPITLPALADVLAKLASERTDTTLAVTSVDQLRGEIMVRGGTPIHAVTGDGRDGPDAMAAILAWRLERIDPGPPPREETPVTLDGPEHPAPMAENAPDPAPDGLPEANPLPGTVVDPPDPALNALLAELARLGIIQKDAS